MNRISTKIQTYYNIMSPQPLKTKQAFSFEKEESQVLTNSQEMANHLRSFTPEIFLHTQEPPFLPFPDYLHVFSLEDAQKMVNKEVLKMPLLLCLEGFNAGLIVIEPLEQEKTQFATSFFSLVFSCLNYLKKVCQDFKRDGINSSYKITFMIRKAGVSEDLLSESGGEGNETLQERFFLDIDELINCLINCQRVGQLKTKDVLVLKTEVYFNDLEDQLCWKGRLHFAGYFGDEAEMDLQDLAEKLEGEKKELEGNCFDFLGDNAGVSLFFEESHEGIMGEQFRRMTERVAGRYAKMNLKLERNKLNDISDYLKTIVGLQKTVAMKDYELSTLKLNGFLKDKENDELKIKIAQLESNLAAMEDTQDQNERNISLLEEEMESDTSIKILESEGNPQTFTRKAEEKLSNNRKTESKISTSKKKLSDTSKILLRSETVSNINNSGTAKEFMKMEGQEQLLEINYFEELSLLRECFHKLNKEAVKLRLENQRLKEGLDEKQKYIGKQTMEIEQIKTKEGENRSLVTKLMEEEGRLKGKNEELQRELIDLYEVYAKKEFGKKK